MSENHYLEVPRAGLEPAHIGGMSGKTPGTGELDPLVAALVFPSDEGADPHEGTQPVPLFPEIAWDAEGRWCGDGVEPAGGPLPIVVPCQCPEGPAGGSLTRPCGTFVCFYCRRAVPWCFGSDLGDGPEDAIDGVLCDDCWCERHGLKGAGEVAAC